MPSPIRALVIDDSAYNRRTLTQLLEESGEVKVIGSAPDGDDGLKEALRLEPDVITLDLEMPRMDGFTFLRLLMARRPTPVIVVSSYARKANVFRALELGAVDFVAKPSRFITKEIESIRDELLEKIRTVRQLKPEHLGPAKPAPERLSPARPLRPRRPVRVAAIGASTGGPPALQHILTALPADLDLALVLVQHMPARFTAAFAERVDKAAAIEVREARDGDRIEAGVALLAPGGLRTEVMARGDDLFLRVRPEPDPDSYVPSIDAVFDSLAEVAGWRSLAVVLTGMGRDGRDGVLKIKENGGAVVAESEVTAVVYGMPKEAAATGKVDRVLPLDEIPAAILEFASGGALPPDRGR
jgi:two-component system chemotaxis response regulator CheB